MLEQTLRQATVAEIGENLIRRNLTASQEALAVARRAELIRALEEERVVDAAPAGAPSRQARRGLVSRPGATRPQRDLAEKTGMSRDKARRAAKRADALGTATLEAVADTRPRGLWPS